jgi:hypothetical protein
MWQKNHGRTVNYFGTELGTTDYGVVLNVRHQWLACCGEFSATTELMSICDQRKKKIVAGTYTFTVKSRNQTLYSAMKEQVHSRNILTIPSRSLFLLLSLLLLFIFIILWKRCSNFRGLLAFAVICKWTLHILAVRKLCSTILRSSNFQLWIRPQIAPNSLATPRSSCDNKVKL